jgi:hypothetical protein
MDAILITLATGDAISKAAAGGYQHVRPSLMEHPCEARPETSRRPGYQRDPPIQPPSHIRCAAVWCQRVVSHGQRAIIPVVVAGNKVG